MMGYTDRATRCNGSRSRIECSSTPAPSSGYMFCRAPIHTPIIAVRRSPKYFQVSDSGPRGSLRRTDCDAADAADAAVVVLDGALTLPPGCQCPEDNIDNERCLSKWACRPTVLSRGNRSAAVA